MPSPLAGSVHATAATQIWTLDVDPLAMDIKDAITATRTCRQIYSRWGEAPPSCGPRRAGRCLYASVAVCRGAARVARHRRRAPVPRTAYGGL